VKVSFTVDMEGFRDLDAALGDMKKSTAKGVMRRALMQVGQPIAEDYASHVAVDSGALRDSAGVGTKLTRRQARLARKAEGRSFVEVFVGAGGLPQATLEEFGDEFTAPRPRLREAWDRGWRKALDSLAEILWAEIRKTLDRAEKRAAKRLAKMGLR